ncbi:hypothetical protein IAU60_002400 [Kwoniella sp. DSM 27419]
MLPAYVLSPAIFALFALSYRFLSPKFSTDRKRAYVLSTISSCVMTITSVPFFLHYLSYGFKNTFEAAQKGWMRELGEFGVVFFGTYLFVTLLTADLAIGYAKYRSQIGMLTGWVHHVVYIGLMVLLYNTRLSPVFLVGCIMELPTFDLAISNLFPATRNDLRFLVSFFTFRIAFHAMLWLDALRPSSRAVADASWIPSVMLGLAGVLHVMWFKGGVLGYLKRSRAASKAEAISGPEITPANPVQHLDTIVEADEEAELGWSDDEPSACAPSTPDDSPLVTPRTPSQAPLFFPALPNLPHIPTVSIPSIQSLPMAIPSFVELTSALHKDKPRLIAGTGGFREAVKARWEEQRGRFVALAGEGAIARRQARHQDGELDLAEDVIRLSPRGN